jgi:sigma-B regulation protein RsbU (phosphoserine phosphatase)
MINLEQMNTPMFASAFYIVVDVASGQMGYANAGHPSPLHVQRAAGTIEWLLSEQNQSGPALGVFKDAVYETIWREITVDDLLVLFTDGLVEVEGDDGEYGEERLLSTVRRHLNLPPTQLFDTLLDEVQLFSGSSDFEDDVCMIGIEVARLELKAPTSASRDD